MSMSWSASSEARSVGAAVRPAEAAQRMPTVSRAAALARELPAWRLPWTRGRLLAGGILVPVLLWGERSLLEVDRMQHLGWMAMAVVTAVLGGLVLGSYLPAGVLGRGCRLRTSVQAATAFFYVVLAGYVLNSPHPGPRHAAFAVAMLLLAVVLRTRGTRPVLHA
ncbi:MAG: hypothetical protein QM714_18930 [Nocardioides sp.]|uniref:hypothetical protein n=1 Tax=Nocardioides sp. TaxID=35761 RepID=UPI0039E6A028